MDHDISVMLLNDLVLFLRHCAFREMANRSVTSPEGPRRSPSPPATRRAPVHLVGKAAARPRSRSSSPICGELPRCDEVLVGEAATRGACGDDQLPRVGGGLQGWPAERQRRCGCRARTGSPSARPADAGLAPRLPLLGRARQCIVSAPPSATSPTARSTRASAPHRRRTRRRGVRDTTSEPLLEDAPRLGVPGSG